MIRPKFLFSICTMAGLLSLSSCNNDDTTYNPSQDGIPASVKENFNSLFPNATDVNWRTTEDGYAVAQFNWQASRSTASAGNHAAWFTMATGDWNMTEYEIDFSQLPQAIVESFNQTEYSKLPWEKDHEVDVLNRNGDKMEKLYVIDVEKEENGIETNADLYYTEDGVLTRVMINAEKDDDYHEFLPQTPSGSIDAYMKAHHPNARIIDLDNEDNGTEVEFIENGKKFEALFDHAGNWIYTKMDYDFFNFADIKNEFPAAVIQTLEAQLNDRQRVEDAEKFITKDSGTYYCFEIEEGRNEFEIYINENGEKLESAPNPGGDSGNSGGIPVPGDIDKFIAEKYPNAVVIDRDYDDGYLEVKILHNQIEKELKFNGANKWVSTTWEIPANQLPEAVKASLVKEGYTIEDDEAEVIEIASHPLLIYEIEVRKGAEDDIDIYIDESGKILHTERD